MRDNNKSGPPSDGDRTIDEERPRGKPVPGELARRVHKIALNALPPRQRATSNLYMDQWDVPKGTKLGPSFEHIVVERDSILCFADHQPLANFSHPCAYLLHDAQNGELFAHVSAQFPPYPKEGIHLMDLFYRAVKPAEVLAPVIRRRRSSGKGCGPEMDHLLSGSSGGGASGGGGDGTPAGPRCAILLAGYSDPHHANDLELSWRMLTDTYKFNADDIYVLVHNGTKQGAPFRNTSGLRKWPGAPAPDNTFLLQPRGKGSIKAFRWALGEVHKKLKNGGLLFLQVEGHGSVKYGSGGGQFIETYPDGANSGDCYLNSQMKADLQQLTGCNSLLVLMNQCYAGGFRDSVLLGSPATRTFFAAACEDNRVSVQTPDFLWNRFSRHWIEAEKQPDPDGKVDASEAYTFCDSPARRGLDTPVMGHAPLNGQSSSPADDIAMGG